MNKKNSRANNATTIEYSSAFPPNTNTITRMLVHENVKGPLKAMSNMDVGQNGKINIGDKDIYDDSQPRTIATHKPITPPQQPAQKTFRLIVIASHCEWLKLSCSSIWKFLLMCLAAHVLEFSRWTRNCQTSTASPAEPGGLPGCARLNTW